MDAYLYTLLYTLLALILGVIVLILVERLPRETPVLRAIWLGLTVVGCIYALLCSVGIFLIVLFRLRELLFDIPVPAQLLLQHNHQFSYG